MDVILEACNRRSNLAKNQEPRDRSERDHPPAEFRFQARSHRGHEKHYRGPRAPKT